MAHGSFRRRHLAAAGFSFAFIFPGANTVALPRIQKKSWRYQQSGKRIFEPLRQGVTFESVTDIFNDKDFLGAFRMSRPAFAKLLDLTRPYLQKNAEMGLRSKRTTIAPDIRLAIGLRMLAGAKEWDMVGFFRIKISSVDRIFNNVFHVLDYVLKWPKIPSTLSQLHDYAMDFKLSRKTPSPFNGCIGALDGIAIRIRKPTDVDDAEYFCRKGFYALPVQALVDSHYRFLFASCLFPGSTHDSVAYRASKLWRYIEKDGKLHIEFWIVGDEAYRCTEMLITPYPRSELDSEKSAFNFFLSKLRNHVEQAFGIMTAKWLILDSPLRFSIKKNTTIVAVVMKLHNFCIENRTDENRLRKWMDKPDFRTVYRDTVRWHRNVRMPERAMEGEEGETDSAVGTDGGRVKSKKREMLLRVVQAKSLQRPPPRAR